MSKKFISISIVLVVISFFTIIFNFNKDNDSVYNLQNQEYLSATSSAAQESYIEVVDLPVSQVKNIRRNIYPLDIDGYFQLCSGYFNIYKQEGGNWVKTFQAPISNFHYIDNNFGNYCDVPTCQKIDNSYTIDLYEYTKVGERVVPNEPKSRLSGEKLPVYSPKPLVGNIRLDINYFSDSNCTVPKTISTLLNIK